MIPVPFISASGDALMKTAHIYDYKGDWYFRPYAQTTAGVWIGMASVVKLHDTMPRSDAGRAALVALNESKESIPHPADWGNLDDDPLLQAAGVKSWTIFMRSAKCVTLDENNGRLKLMPQNNLGPKEGYVPIPKEAIELPLNSPPQHIGIALEDALARCQSSRSSTPFGKQP
jgi:hypothetical protein